MISSVSNRGSKLYIDGKNQEIEIIPPKKFPEYEFLSQYSTILAGFGDNSAAWALLAGNKSDSRTTPEQNQQMQECINTQGKYIRKIKGRLLPGRF